MIQRNITIDFFKALAAFSVVSLHVGNYDGFHEMVGVFIRLSGRWAVPFFFIVSGYFLGKNLDKINTYVYKQMFRIVRVLCFSSLLFLPYVFLKNGLQGGYDFFFSAEFFLRSTYFHLWYLNSLLLGLVLISFFYRFKLQKVLWLISLFLIIAAVISDVLAYSNTINEALFIYFRQLISIPFLFIGILLSNKHIMNKLTLLFACILVLLGIVIQLTEAYVWNLLLGSNPMEHQFLFGTLFFSLGMFGISLNITIQNQCFLSEIGKNYSLGIYLLHPLWIPVISVLLNVLIFKNRSIYSFLKAIITSVMTMLTLILCRRHIPIVKELIDGKSILNR